ncbi:MAG: cation:proton antiporter [Candidatus Micrarchaeia archaeon]
MEQTTYLLQFSFFIVFALLGTIISLKLRQPYVVGLLVFGMLAGPNMLGLVDNRDLIGTFSELGAILLLFTVGIEFSITRILRSGVRAVLITAFKMGALFFLGYEAALYFGLDLTSALAAGAMISVTSTAIMFKVVSQKGMAKNSLMPLLFSMLIVEDIVAVAALTFFSSLSGGAGTSEDKFYSILISLGLLGLFYFVVRRPAAKAIFRLTSTLNAEVMIFVSFSLCLAMSMVAGYFNLSTAIGAFLAGSIISTLPNARSIEKTLKPLLLTFASLFFLSLGMQIEPAVILANLPFAAAFTLIFAAGCFLSVFTLLYFTGAQPRDAMFGASAMVVMGEFSLLIASSYAGQHSSLLIAACSLGVVVTAIISSFLLDRQERLIALEQRLVPAGARRAAQPLSDYFKSLLRDFSPSGSFWKVSHTCWDCASRKLVLIAAISVVSFVLRFAVRFMDVPKVTAGQLSASIFLLSVLPILWLFAGILGDLKPLLDKLSKTIARHKKDAKLENVILRDVAIAVVFMLLSLVLPEIVMYLQLPAIFTLGDELAFLLALVFIWDLIGHARKLHSRRKRG